MKAKNPGFTLDSVKYALRVCRRGPLNPALPRLLLALLFFFPAAAFSQWGSSAGGSTVPFVSRLEAEAKNNLIRLTWKDSPDARGPVYIYRSDTPFNSAQPGLGKPRPVETPYGVEYYIDEAESAGRIYYFVAASDESGKRYDTLLPGANSIAVDVSDILFPETPSFSDDPEPAGIRGGIYALETKVLGEEVSVSFLTNFPGRNLVLYRSVRPITRTIDLLSAVIVQTGLSSPFTDYPVPGIQYYYAVIFEDELTRGKVGIYPGHNATEGPVEVKAGKGRVGLPGVKAEIRSMPLPLMSLEHAAPELEGLAEAPAEPVPLSPAVRRAVESLIPPGPRPLPKKRPRAFSQDLDDEEAVGEEWALKTIVRDHFVGGDWENSCLELRRYLSRYHSAGIAARARFYLAQALYFSLSYREALREFLLVRDFFPQEANEWINASLAALAD
ncbi:MAG: hypothetical protein LBT87_01670 [Treponema sp.]|jgi:hypothetical protein|nr:hypothetical protein [Treponema sp.]